MRENRPDAHAMSETFLTRSEQETVALAEKLAGTLTAGTCVLLYGDLGAGKTAFVRGLAAGLGANPEEVSSPTFVIMQHYKGRVPLIHVDLYRLDNAAAVDDLGLEELALGGVLAIEWADKLMRVFNGSLSVRIEDAGEDSRTIVIDRHILPAEVSR
jgi:tRNA threonylcarbamoyladenosine biosynthesis protein TsaE